MTATRGLRNNNPGNLRHGDPWQGLAKEQPDKDFCTFVSPAFGIRAMAVCLIAYQDKHGLRTPAQMVARWAPASENDTSAYVSSVCEQTGFGPHDMIDAHDFSTLRTLVQAIIRHENGEQPYSLPVVEEGLRMAGVVAPSGTASATRTVENMTIAIGVVGAAIAQGVEIGKQVEVAAQPLASVVDWLPQVMGFAAVLVVAGVVLWRRTLRK